MEALIAHAMPRRVRLSAPRLTGHRDACERAAAGLAAFASTRVRVRPETGSFILEDDEGHLDAGALQRRLSELVCDARDEAGRRLVELPQESHPGPPRVVRAVAHAASGINADVRAALGYRADLGTLLPLFFAAAGTVEVLKTQKLPVPAWFNLLWWSMRSFMTFNFRAVEEEANGGGDAPTCEQRP